MPILEFDLTPIEITKVKPAPRKIYLHSYLAARAKVLILESNPTPTGSPEIEPTPLESSMWNYYAARAKISLPHKFTSYPVTKVISPRVKLGPLNPVIASTGYQLWASNREYCRSNMNEFLVLSKPIIRPIWSSKLFINIITGSSNSSKDNTTTLSLSKGILASPMPDNKGKKYLNVYTLYSKIIIKSVFKNLVGGPSFIILLSMPSLFFLHFSVFDLIRKKQGTPPKSPHSNPEGKLSMLFSVKPTLGVDSKIKRNPKKRLIKRLLRGGLCRFYWGRR